MTDLPPSGASGSLSFPPDDPFVPLPGGKRPDLKALGLAACLNAVLFGLFFAWATPYYETNDDLFMQGIASGLFTGQPSEYLIFTSVLIGWPLRVLYGLWPGCNWYFGYLIATHYAALTAIAFVVLSRRRGWRWVLLYTVFFLVVETRILLLPQFTTTAFLAGTAGVLLLVDGLQPGGPPRWGRVVTGIVLTAWMGMIREPVVPLLALIATPFLIERFGWSGWRRLAAVGLACAGVFLVAQGINRLYYQRDPGWAEYMEYNRLRGHIHSTELQRLTSQAAPAIGWTTNDANMFVWFYFSEPEVYAGATRMHAFYDQLKTLSQGGFRWNFSARYLLLPRVFVQPDTGALMKLALLSALGCLLAAGNHRRRFLVTLLVLYGLLVLLSFYLQRTAHLPERVSYNLPLFIIAMCLFWATDAHKKPAATKGSGFFSGMPATSRVAGVLRTTKLALFTFAIGIFIYLCLLFAFDLAQNLWYANAAQRRLRELSREICNPVLKLLPPGQKPLLVFLPLDSTLEKCLFFYPPNEIPFFSVPWGWISHSPIFRQVLDQRQLRPYSLSLVDRPDVFILMETRWLEPLRTFYREHYGLDVRFEMVLNTDEMPQYTDFQLYLYQAHAAGRNAPPAPLH